MAFVGVLVLVLLGCEKQKLNALMDDVCKIDGGEKVFEQVILPAARFGKYGELLPVASPMHKGYAKSPLGDEYRLDQNMVVIKDGETHDRLYSEGKLVRHSQKIVRVRDNLVLGESVWYSRIGGELTPFGMPSVSQCPPHRKGLAKLVFLKGE